SEIIECLRKRQSYVVRYLSARYMPMINLMISQTGGSPEDGKDIFQEGLMIMIEKIDNKDFALTCKLKTFVYCVCENLWKSVLSRRKLAADYLKHSVNSDNNDDIPGIIDDTMYREIFLNAFETLDPVRKNILKLYWEDMSLQEIADKFGYTYAYTKKRKCEAQSELIKRVKDNPDYIKIMRSERTAEAKGII
ncbi:MAG: sigma-70 family RNA polymerase sigma factor, partial [Bacteroidales bacterium]|nr:sigma-70 family RNA polymerase sigma factor [Bacteroidales bacterium]